MPPSWHPAPACAPRLRCRRAILSCSIKVAASILKSEPEIKNRCSLWDGSGENHAVIPNSGPEIKNHCTLEGVSKQKPAVIPKSGLEIKNRCSYKNRRRYYSSLQLRKLESDAEDRCRYESSRRNHSSLQRRNLNRTRNSLQQSPLLAKLFFFAASKIRI